VSFLRFKAVHSYARSSCIEGLLAEGLRHGFFHYSIHCEVGREGRRQLVIEAGKSHKFTIPANELP
jgi:hypothetical protein